MLRTNQPFLEYLDKLYTSEEHEGKIILKSFEKDDHLFVQNEVSTEIMLVKTGITKCFFNQENGTEYIVEFLGKGEVLGEIEVVKNVPCICSIDAITEVSAYSMSIPYFQELIKNDANFNKLLVGVFAERIVNSSNRASYQKLHHKETTLAQLLDERAKEMKMSKDDMAAYFGITMRSLNRAMKAFEEKENSQK